VAVRADAGAAQDSDDAGPDHPAGVAFRITREVVFFESLFRGNKWIWIFGWMFHFGLFLVTLRHLRYFIEPGLGADPVHSAVRYLRRHRDGRRARRPLGAAVPGRPGALHHGDVGPPDPRLLFTIGMSGLVMQFLATPTSSG
jgi:hypothetical protein